MWVSASTDGITLKHQSPDLSWGSCSVCGTHPVPFVRIYTSLALQATRTPYHAAVLTEGHRKLGIESPWSTYFPDGGFQARPARKASSSPPPLLTKLAEFNVDKPLQGNTPIANAAGPPGCRICIGANANISGCTTSSSNYLRRKGHGQTMPEGQKDLWSPISLEQ